MSLMAPHTPSLSAICRIGLYCIDCTDSVLLQGAELISSMSLKALNIALKLSAVFKDEEALLLLWLVDREHWDINYDITGIPYADRAQRHEEKMSYSLHISELGIG